MSWWSDIIAKKKVPDDEVVGRRRNVHDEARDPEWGVDVIGDLDNVAIKGAPKQSKTG